MTREVAADLAVTFAGIALGGLVAGLLAGGAVALWMRV
jgi:hypothetical protein